MKEENQKKKNTHTVKNIRKFNHNKFMCVSERREKWAHIQRVDALNLTTRNIGNQTQLFQSALLAFDSKDGDGDTLGASQLRHFVVEAFGNFTVGL